MPKLWSDIAGELPRWPKVESPNLWRTKLHLSGKPTRIHPLELDQDFRVCFSRDPLHYTPEHCLVNCGFPLLWRKKPCFKWAKCIFQGALFSGSDFVPQDFRPSTGNSTEASGWITASWRSNTIGSRPQTAGVSYFLLGDTEKAMKKMSEFLQVVLQSHTTTYFRFSETSPFFWKPSAWPKSAWPNP